MSKKIDLSKAISRITELIGEADKLTEFDGADKRLWVVKFVEDDFNELLGHALPYIPLFLRRIVVHVIVQLVYDAITGAIAKRAA